MDEFEVSITEEDDFEVSSIAEDVEDNTVQSDVIEYPCLILDGITTLPEMKFLVERKNVTDTILTLYVRFEDVVKRITTLDFSMEVLQLLRSISKGYRLHFLRSPSEEMELDLSDATTYIKLLKIK